jgi:phosphate:Na+ symporter
MYASSAVDIVGGIGLFLLGIHHLTEGLKGLSGDSLRRTLQKFVSGRFSAVISGVVLTVATQSSTATILAVIGFVGAGLITLSQAIAVNMGATLGTTSTPWMVAILGLRLRIASVALPILGIGAFLWLVARGKTRSLGAVLAGFGLIFTGIDFLQTGMAGVKWNLDAWAGTGLAAMWILAGIGIVMTVVMQSSSAAVVTTLVALDAGSLTFEQACAMVVGQSIGTAVTTGLAVISGGIDVRRTALAHIIYSLVVGVLGMLFLKPLTGAAEWVGSQLDDSHNVLALAAFSTIFKFMGVVAFYPWINPFARLVVRISGKGSDSAVSRLDSTLANAGGGVALEAGWRASLELGRDAIDVVRRRFEGELVAYAPPITAVQEIDRFLESLSLETIDLTTIGPRLIRLVHALDHLAELHDDLAQLPAPASGWRPPTNVVAGAQALAGWLAATKDPESVPEPYVLEALRHSSEQLTLDRDSTRKTLLEDIALQRTPAATARAHLEILVWADRTLYHAWRLAESVQKASGKLPTTPVDVPPIRNISDPNQ